jgi:CubicO group peptidase (beta-lactamase class C family)
MKIGKSVVLIVIGAVMLTSFGCGGGGGSESPQDISDLYNYEIPMNLNDGWTVGSLADANIEQEQIVRMTRDIEATVFTRIDSVVIVRNRVLVHEAYFNGLTAGSRHDLRSATKSITSMLIGISIDQGLLPDANTAVLPYIASLNPIANWDDRKNEIRVNDFLTMSSGLDCDDSAPESPGNEENMYRKNDWVQFVWDLPMLNDPGDTYAYCTGGVVVLGDLISNVAGRRVDDFASSELFAHLNISDYNWELTPAGQVDTGGHIHMLPRDMAKIGETMLRDGVWNGQSIISDSWVQESTQERLIVSEGTSYGYLWWRRAFGGNGEYQSFIASGNGGQYIFVIPGLDLVIVFTGTNYNSSLSSQPLAIIDEYIIPATN